MSHHRAVTVAPPIAQQRQLELIPFGSLSMCAAANEDAVAPSKKKANKSHPPLPDGLSLLIELVFGALVPRAKRHT